MDNDKSMTITIDVVISPKMIEDLAVTALEGGINYWCRKVRIKDLPAGTEENSESAKKMAASEVISLGGSIILYDTESDDNWLLTRDKFINGIKLHCEEKCVMPDALWDDHDACDADAIVQYALFGELTFA